MLTSKAKYALRAMIDLAAQTGAGPRRPLFIGDIAQRQDIPRRFLENILLELRKHGLVVSHRGKAGGYALARAPDPSLSQMSSAPSRAAGADPLHQPHGLSALRGLPG